MKKILISFIAALAMSAIGQTTYKWQYPTDILVPGTSSYTLFFNRSANNVPYIKKPDNTIQSLQSLMGLTPGAATWGSITGTLTNQTDLKNFFIPRAGTYTNYPLYGPIEFSVGTTALWQDTSGAGYYVGYADNKNIGSAGEASYTYYNDSQVDVTTYKTDGSAGSVSTTTASVQIISQSPSMTHVANVAFTPSVSTIDYNYGSYQGLTYGVSTATTVAANQGNYSILHRAAGDARWAQLSAPNTFTGINTFSNTIKYVDGNQGSGKILTSDASGNASWASPSASTFTINGTGMSTGSSYTIQASTTNSLNIGTGLALSSGTAWNGATTNTLSLSASASNLTNGTTGTGSVVLSSGATLTTPTLGVASATSLALTGAGGSGFLSLTTQTAQPSSPSSGTVLFSNSNSKLSWKGSGNTYMKTFDAGNNSADRVYSLPNRDAKLDSITTSTGTAINGILRGTGTVVSSYSTSGTGTVVPLATGASLTSPTITTGELGSSTATTQAAGDNSTKIATTAYVDGKTISIPIGAQASTLSSGSGYLFGSIGGTFQLGFSRGGVPIPVSGTITRIILATYSATGGTTGQTLQLAKNGSSQGIITTSYNTTSGATRVLDITGLNLSVSSGDYIELYLNNCNANTTGTFVQGMLIMK